VRPLRLEVEGFTAFRDHLELDLSSLDLFAVTGQTGAGKSSLIDAICFALYGRVPRVANEIKECISLGLARMYVALDFQASGGDYRVFREAKKQGQPNVRLERCVAGEWQALAHGATEVTKRVESIVGLNYDAFTRSVLLPQGQFQEFLSGSPDKRRDVLQSLLRLDVYKRMQARANEIAAAHRQQAEGIEHELDTFLKDATPENLQRRTEDRDLALSEAASLVERIEAWRKALEEAKAYAASLEAFRRARDQRQEAADRLAAAEGALRDGDAEIADLQKALDEAEAALKANGYDDELLAALTAAAAAAASLESSREKLRQAEQQFSNAQAGADTAGKSETAAEAAAGAARVAFAQAEASFEEARHRNQAAAVQAGLKPGDTCPVCGGKIEKLPPIDAGGLETARSALDEARAALDGAQKALARAGSDRAAAAERLKSAERVADECRRQVEADETRLRQALPQGAPAQASALDQMVEAQKRARLERGRLSTDRERALESLQSARERLADARAKAAGLRALFESQDKAYNEATEATKQAHASLTALAQRDGLEAISEALHERRDVVAAAAAQLDALAARNDAVQQEIGRLNELIDRLKDDIEKAVELHRRLAKVRADQELAGDLSQMLMANRFQAFMQAEALRMLAVEGSQRLEKLSGGRYRLDISANGQDFEAIDQWNADDKRSVRTLSGGETFLASLALSLALAESLPGLAPDGRVTLDAIFLDEGFGSLDPDALEHAAEALDSLRDGTRMVCVVTHLQELAQRMPARIVVEKSESGSRVAIAV
jgi:exonuclease SbcC